MVQVTQASSLFRPTCILLVDHGLRRLGSLPDESGRMPKLRRVNCAPYPLTFCAHCALKRFENLWNVPSFIFCTEFSQLGWFYLSRVAAEDPRFSGNTQYLGGGYGGGRATGGPPRDTVSYWDGDQASGSPSIKISLGEQRAYFYKSGVLVGVSQLSTGREGLNTPDWQL